MSNAFRKMRGISDKVLNEALVDHREVLGRLVRSSIAQNRWNVGMVLMILVAYVWMAALTFGPAYVNYVPVAGLSLFVVILVTRKVSTYRWRRRMRQAQAAMAASQEKGDEG